MRILQLRFKNLNSLNGEWEIDFTDPSYISNGIFAVTGPTGAGKTTIFDAICLALYGQTPRLEKITENENEIMSRQTGECFSETTFETKLGRFRCHWSQRRARKKADGKLQTPKREISEATTGEIQESKRRDVAAAVEKFTGMDFERFKRSMLLAQGGFDLFLRADPDEKSPILEQITGTEIYSRISIETHERHREEKQKLELLEAELKGISLLSEEEQKELGEKLDQKQREEKELALKNESFARAAAWLDNIDKLEKELKTIEDELSTFRQRQEKFESDQKKMDKADKALSLEGEFVALSSLRKQQKKDGESLSAAQKLLPEHKLVRAQSKAVVKETETALETRRQILKKERETLKEVRALDLKINEKNKAEQSSNKEINKLLNEIEQQKKQKKQTEKKRGKTQTDITSLEKYLMEHERDSKLVSEFAGVRQTLKNLARFFDSNDKLRRDIEKAQKKLDEQSAARAKQEKSLNKSRARLNALEKETGQISESIAERLDGRETRDIRDELDQLKERSRLLEQTSELLDKISASEKKLPELQKIDNDFKENKKSANQEVKNISEKLETQEREVGHLEKLLILMNRVKDLEFERSGLEDGEPCPLCGSKSHPYAQGNIPSPGKTEKQLKTAKEKLKAFSEQKSKLEVRQAKLDKDIEQSGQKIKNERSRLEKDKTMSLKLLQSLNISADRDNAAEETAFEQASARKRAAVLAELVANLEKDEKILKTKEKKLGALRESFNKQDKESQKLKHNEDAAEKELRRISQEKTEAAELLRKDQERVLQQLKDYGIHQAPESKIEIESATKALSKRLKAWQTKLEQKNSLDKQLVRLDSELEKYRLLTDRRDDDLKLKSALRDELTEELEIFRKNRKALYDDKNADDEEKRLENLVENSEKKLSETRELYNKSKLNLNGLEKRVSSLIEERRKRAAEIDETERAFELRLSASGFQNKADYQDARLPQKEREALRRKANNLSKKQTELKTRQKDRISKLDAERKQKITTQSREKLAEKLSAASLELKKLGEKIGGVKQRFSEDAKARSQHRERAQAIDAQKKERDRWETLHRLIGSADGKKYRNFAQGLTFEIVIAQANRRLQKMTDRYLLLKDKTRPLDLNVIDNYQAGEVRSVKNLSGGESFIVSLSLALGLSRMAGRKVSVDSLFLDEGFGALDEESLETALEALSGLRHDGKLIGIISHVAQLKERISSQIQVLPQTNGQSLLSGPGCRKV